MSLPCAVVTVTYRPDLVILARQLAALPQAVTRVIVDNGSGANTEAALTQLAQSHPGVVVRCLGRNIGLAAGLNAGVRIALAESAGAEFVLFLDQDTEPEPGDVGRLVDAAIAVHAADPRAGVFGPLMVDAATGLSHGVHRIRCGRWVRHYPAVADAAPIPSAGINGSGMLMRVAVFESLGGFDEALFIDQVDTEMSFRAAAAGHALLTLPQVRFRHRMGDRTLRFWLGSWRAWPHRTPARHRYLFRNAVLLLRRPYVPRTWKFWAPVKLLVTALVHLVIDRERFAQLSAMSRGVADGLRGRSGPVPPA